MPADEEEIGRDAVRVFAASDRSKVWRWGNVLAPVFVGAVSIGILGAAPDGPPSAQIYAIAFGIGIPLALIGAYAPCLFWRFVTATRRYELDKKGLRVWSRGRILIEIPLSRVVHFKMRGRVSAWSFIFSPSTWLTWPRGMVTVSDDLGNCRIIRLPELILWGDAVREVEEKISSALKEVKQE